MKINQPLRSLLFSVLIGSNLLVWALSGFSLYNSRLRHEQQAAQQTQNIVRALEQTLTHHIEQIEHALFSTAIELERRTGRSARDWQTISEFTRQIEERIPEIEAIRISDASGRVIFGKGVEQNHPVSWADRDYFLTHRQHADRKMLIAKARIGRAAKQAIIGLSMRYNTADGRFAGVISAPIAVSHLEKLLGEFKLGASGTVILRDADYGLIARAPAIPDQPAGQLGNSHVSREFLEIAASGARQGTYYTPRGADGYSRISSYALLRTAPLLVVAGMSKQDYLATWEAEMASTFAIASGYLLLSVFAGVVVLRLLNRQESDRQRLAEREARLKSIVDHEPECIKLVAADGRLLEMNPAGLRMIEAEDLQQVAGRSVFDLLAPEHRIAFAEMHARVIGGAVQSLEFEIIGLRGTRRWMETHATPLHVGGEILQLAVTRDISERKRAASERIAYQQHLEQLVAERTAALAATEARAQQILNASAHGIYGVDRHGKLTFINPAACRLLGYSEAQLLGYSAHALFHARHPDGRPYPAHECPAHRSLQHGQTLQVDHEVYWRADGQPLPVMYSVLPLLENGQVTGAVTSFVDISEQQAAVRAREQALIAAENLARMRSEFLANMSHEIRTPLNGILGFSEIGERHVDEPARARDAFTKIRSSGERLLGIINDILDFSKIEAGKLTIECIPVDLNEVIEHSLSLVRDRAASKGLQLVVRLAPNLPQRCLSDPLRIGQILLNVLGNAVKFTESGHIELQVEAHAGMLHFYVSDTGIGISEAQCALLFTPFHQADPSSTRRFGGTGLGLAICKRIVDLMHGRIEVSSRPGAGTRIEFCLPYQPLPAQAPQQTSPTPTQAPDEMPLTSTSLAGVRILAAEDEPINQEILHEVLSSLGAEVTLVANGEQAVAALQGAQAQAYDLVLMDVQMPGMDGYAAAQALRAGGCRLPIIAQTAHAFPEERERCLAAGMDAHIAKPLDLGQLIALIRSLGIQAQAVAPSAAPV